MILCNCAIVARVHISKNNFALKISAIALLLCCTIIVKEDTFMKAFLIFLSILLKVLIWIGRAALPLFIILLFVNWLYAPIPTLLLFLPLQIFIASMALYIILYTAVHTIKKDD